MSQTRRLAAILAADVAGYSRLIGADEGGTLERLKALRRELLDPKITEHNGRLVKTTRSRCSRRSPSGTLVSGRTTALTSASASISAT